ncbi:MAG: hypothetical protein ACKO23_10630, partial [Gemmataceae bacterium]
LREDMRNEFWSRQFLLGGWPGCTDTYKRTMWAAVPDIALQKAGYSLTMRKGLPEKGGESGLIMAGHEAMLRQWFHRPLRRSIIQMYGEWYARKSFTRAFPRELWEDLLAKTKTEDIYLPIDVHGFPGGQTFLPGVPCLVFEGIGGLVSYLEPAMCRYFAPIIQATKARLMSLATPRDAEFGLRASPSDEANIILLLARYVGGRGRYTSNDTAEFLFPEYFQAIGTIGHEMMGAGQNFSRSLAQAEYEMMDRFVTAMGTASLLCDLVDAETVGLDNAIRVIRAHPETSRVGIRVDSGNVAEQCVLYHLKLSEAGYPDRTIVFEDEVSPEMVREVFQHFRNATGKEPTMLFPGAGGYWWRLVHRDTVAAAFKRTATGSHPNMKFSNSPGKESLGGYLRVYGKEDALIVADVSEPAVGEPLFVKLVDQGRIVYSESFEEQADRADRTWGKYRRWEMSPLVREYFEKFTKMRKRDIEEARRRLGSS